MTYVWTKSKMLNKLGIELSEEFEKLFGDSECYGGVCPDELVCPYCQHPGHPDQLENTEEAWEIYKTVPQLIKKGEDMSLRNIIILYDPNITGAKELANRLCNAIHIHDHSSQLVSVDSRERTMLKTDKVKIIRMDKL